MPLWDEVLQWFLCYFQHHFLNEACVSRRRLHGAVGSELAPLVHREEETHSLTLVVGGNRPANLLPVPANIA